MIDWEKIKTEYLTTDTSYRKLAKKYKVNATTIAKKAKQEEWVDEKSNKSKQTQAKLTNIAEKQTVSDFEALISLNERLIKLAEQKIKGYELLAKDNEGQIEVFSEALDVRQIKGLTDTIAVLVANIRNLKGLPTQNESETQYIARKRLEIEEKKADIDTSDREIRIIFENENELKEYAE